MADMICSIARATWSDPITPKRELTIDELIERWINDDADAPIPAELFVTS